MKSTLSEGHTIKYLRLVSSKVKLSLLKNMQVWWNGLHSGLKIRTLRGLWVRIPLPVLIRSGLESRVTPALGTLFDIISCKIYKLFDYSSWWKQSIRRVAQLGERRYVGPDVDGSIPSSAICSKL